MALDPSIILQAGRFDKPDYATTLGQIGQLRAQRDQSELQRVQLSRLAREDAAAQTAQAVRTRAGAAYAQGDTQGALSEAAGAGQFDLVKSLQEMSDADRKRAFEISQHAAPVLASLTKLPPEARAAAAQQAIPMLAEAGWKEPQLAEFQANATNDNWLGAKIAAAHTIAEYDAQANADRTAKLAGDKFVYDQKNDALNRGVTMRGQDFSHADSAAGRAVTMRGQNLTDARSRETNANARAPSGYRFDPSGNLVAIKGGPADKSQGALTEVQGKAMTFGARMVDSNRTLKELDKKGVHSTGIVKNTVGSIAGLVPLGVGDKLADMADSTFNTLPRALGGPNADQQSLDQAQRNFLNAILRRESGAAISPGEFANGTRQYFPHPGDSAQVRAQKARNRDIAIAGIRREAGPGAVDIDTISAPPKAPPKPKGGVDRSNPLLR